MHFTVSTSLFSPPKTPRMFSSSSRPSVRILETSRISPPQGSVPPTSLPLTFFDVMWLSSPPTERLFFYPFPYSTSHLIDSILPTLKSSLSITLQSFYPLAGTLQRIPGSSDDFELCYFDGDSVALTVAECVDGGFDIPARSDARDISNLRPLLPTLPKLGDSCPLLAIQVTVFPSDGVVIGTALHHVACDGTSFTHFRHSWASACRSGGSASERHIPIIDRSLIPDPRGLYSIFKESLSRLMNLISRGSSQPATAAPADLLLATFTLTRAHIKMLKEVVLAKTDQKKPFHLSTFVVTFAYIWVGFVRLREQLSPGRKRAHLSFGANFRDRIQPALPPAYFGNCVGSCFVEADVGELVGGDGLKVASEAIGRAIEGLNVSLESSQEWLTRFASIMNEQPMGVAGSPKFGVYDVDFGWGRPAKVDIPSIANSDAISLAESREDPGGVEIGFALPKHEMGFLKNYLENGLKTLSEKETGFH
ncbi:anthocyanin 5-aromatic acyltransferase-like [Typha latifolia]|uniref:anthocyanin 5-aromatic acyltransferase-like n=1 Tax=Typha latifolia TaxID=4733 RepID=UPI003C2E0708